MKKFVLGILTTLGLGIGAIFAQNNILPDEAEIVVKSPILEGESANFSITMMKNGSKMTNYTGTIYISIEDSNGAPLKSNEFTLLESPIYTFSAQDLGFKEFQKGLEIKKEGVFYLQVEDNDDPDEKILGRQQITVTKNAAPKGDYHVDIFSPLSESTVTNDKLDILGSIQELPNSKALIYIDNEPAINANVDPSGVITHSIPNIDLGRHSLKIEIPDLDGSILGTSDKIFFTVVEGGKVEIKDVSVYPKDLLMVGDKVKITVLTDEMVESVTMKLSDRPDNNGFIMTPEGRGEFTYNAYLVATGEVNISLETTTANNSVAETHENVEKFYVLDTPEISDIKFIEDPENRSGTIYWDVLYGDPITYYQVKYRGSDGEDISGEMETENKSFTFKDIPFDREINVNVTPFRKDSLNLPDHGTASKTIKFLIKKPNICGDGVCDAGETAESCPDDCGGTTVCGNGICELGETAESCPNDCAGPNITQSSCIAQAVPVRTTKIGDNYYLIRDKVKNVTKYIIYSSTTQDAKTRTKIFETKDTSYEYPFDYNAKEDTYMYFWVVGICEDGGEIELSGATKVQVGPTENFFLLLCLTFLIYFGIKLFRETE